MSDSRGTAQVHAARWLIFEVAWHVVFAAVVISMVVAWLSPGGNVTALAALAVAAAANAQIASLNRRLVTPPRVEI